MFSGFKQPLGISVSGVIRVDANDEMRFDANHGVRFDAIGWQVFVYELFLFCDGVLGRISFIGV